jgi:polyisoprenoid-binding protein YceI
VWDLDSSNGQLLLKTGVAGPAAKMGHRLTIAVDWHATVQWVSGEPVSVELTVDVGSLTVQRGDGGVTGLSGPEKALARSNALKCLDADRYPHIRFRADSIGRVDAGYRLDGTLEIHGTTRDRVIDLHVEEAADSWRMSCDTEVSQAEFGVKPYSMMMGAMKVADAVTVSFSARYAKDS